jgi:hypothetical protein
LKKLFFALFIIVLGYLSVRPLFVDGFFPVHDNVQIERVYEMSKAVKDGQFPVRWVKDLGYGYGYPIFNFYSPLPYYLGGVFNLLGFDLIQSTKMMFFVGIILAGVTMFLLGRQIWNSWSGGLLSGVLYLYAPYHALDIYVRGAVGEFWAMGFLPLIFLGIDKIGKTDSIRGVLIGILGIAGVILSHNLTSLMMLPFLSLYTMFVFYETTNKRSFVLKMFCLLILSLAVSCFYWLPALYEMKFTNIFSQVGGGADFRNHFIFIDQLWDFPWGFGGSAGKESGISYKIGKPNIVLFILAVLFFIFKIKLFRQYKAAIFSGLAGFSLAVFMTNKVSLPLWELIGVLSFIQYPWRHLLFAAFFTSLTAGFVTIFLKKIFQKDLTWLIYLLVLPIVFFHGKYFNPQYFTFLPADSYTKEEHLNWSASRVSDEYLLKDFISPKYEIDIPKERISSQPNIKITQDTKKTHIEKFLTNGDSFSRVTINSLNFPGWEVKVDGRKILLSDSTLLTFTIPSGNHLVEAEFKNTFIRSLANLVSIFGLMVLSVILLRLKYAKSI